MATDDFELGFERPDWDRPIDLDQILISIPAGATAKGVFFRTPCKQALSRADRVVGRGEYGVFSDYPVRELAEVLAESAGFVYPSLPLRKALRLMGQQVYSSVLETRAGGFVIKMAGGNLMAALKATGRIYKMFSSDTTAEVTQLADNEAVVCLRNSWTFPDAYHVGVFEGALTAFRKQGLIQVRTHSLCDVDLKVTFA